MVRHKSREGSADRPGTPVRALDGNSGMSIETLPGVGNSLW